MEIRGTRRCTDCDTQWSYFETGSVACPACGSMHSVGVDDRSLHTDGHVSLDVSRARNLAGTDDIEAAADATVDATRSYVRARGFIDAGELRRLDDIVLGAYELREVGRHLTRTIDRQEGTERYFLTLLDQVPDGDRPAPDAVPDTVRGVHGLAVAAAVDAYLRDFTQWLDATEDDHPQALSRVLGQLRDHRRRLEALDGDVPPEDADRLVTATRALATYAKHHDPHDLETARSTLDSLA